MIDHEKAEEAIVKLNKQNFENLLLAGKIEKYLYQIWGDAVDTNYSPMTSTMLIKCFDHRSMAQKNLIASVKQAAMVEPDTQERGQSVEGWRIRLGFASGLNVMIIESRKI